MAEEAAAQQQLAASQTKKRNAPLGKVPQAAKKRKMASVQQLHTAQPALGSAKACQRSRSISQSCSEICGTHPRAGSTSPEADSQHNRQGSVEAVAQELSPCGAALASGTQATQPATSSEPQPHTGADTAAPAAAAQQSHAAGQSSSHGACQLTSVQEYYVKWKGKSYLHCSWVRHDDVLKVARRLAGLNMRFRHYQRSVYGMPQVIHHKLALQ